MTDAIAGFLAELRARSSQVEVINELERLMREVELMATTDSVLEEFMQAVGAIVGRTDRTLKEKIDTVHRLCNTPDCFGRA
jgi:hypothetical protein